MLTVFIHVIHTHQEVSKQRQVKHHTIVSHSTEQRKSYIVMHYAHLCYYLQYSFMLSHNAEQQGCHFNTFVLSNSPIYCEQHPAHLHAAASYPIARAHTPPNDLIIKRNIFQKSSLSIHVKSDSTSSIPMSIPSRHRCEVCENQCYMVHYKALSPAQHISARQLHHECMAKLIHLPSFLASSLGTYK